MKPQFFFRFFFIAVFLTGFYYSNSQTFTTTVSGTSDWGQANNWIVSDDCEPGGGNSYSGTPPTSGAWHPQCPVNIVITRDMTLPNQFVTEGYVNSLTVTNGATLTVNNSVRLQQNALSSSSIVIESGATLNISNSLTISDNRTFIVNGDLNVSGTVTGGGNLLVQNGGEINSTGNLNVNGVFNLNGDGKLIIGGTVTVGGGSSLNITTGASMTVNGNFSHSGSSVVVNGALEITGEVNISQPVHVYGTLEAGNNVDLTGRLNIHPGGKVIIQKTVTVIDSEYLIVGTSASPPEYADLVIKGNLISQNSGDVSVNRNGRVAVYGDLTANGGGTFLRIMDGGQVFVNGSIDMSGGSGNTIDNQNTEVGFIGLYVGDTVIFDTWDGFTGATQDPGDQDGNSSSYAFIEDMPGENNPFLEWLQQQEDTPVDQMLPVSLLYFKAEKRINQVTLTWQTATEIDNDYFTIEKSIDGRYFEVIDYVSGSGSTKTQRTYTWQDMHPVNGLTYYRLSQTDYDGSTEIIGLEAVVPQDHPSGFSIYPNPVTVGQALTIQGVIPEHIVLIDPSGKDVFSGTPVSASLPLPALKPGLYVLKGISENRVHTQSILVK